MKYRKELEWMSRRSHAAAMTPSALLAVEDLTCTYGSLVALAGASLTVHSGECICIVGPNGAGKTTLLSNVAGLFRPSAGSIVLDGRPIAGLGAERIAQLGISLVPEGRRIFGTLTVEENLRLGATVRRRDGRVGEDMERVTAQFPILRQRFRSEAGRLSGGEQQMLAIARALMSRPRLIMIDEPSLGLAPLMIDRVYEILAGLRAQRGLAMMIVEQSTARIADIADRMHVVRSGRVVLSGTPAEIAGDAILDEAYFGFGGATDAAI
jgi:branched-chain amino acid transport system ATP-binding protein